MNEEMMQELLYQALETEMGGVQVYQTALRCVQNEELKEEWEEYLEHTQRHVEIVREVFTKLDLDPETETPGRVVVRHIGESLVKAIQMALESGPPEAAELVATECVVHAETKEDEHLDHTTGWSRELWIQGLGMPAVLPPPEEEKDVKTAIGAARAKQERGRMKKAS